KNHYLEIIKEFNFLIREIRFIERSGGSVGRLNINNIGIYDLVGIDLSGVEKKYNENSPASIFPELSEELKINLDNSKEYFSGKPGEHWYRGKQHLDFYRIFLGKIKVDRCKKDGREIFQRK